MITGAGRPVIVLLDRECTELSRRIIKTMAVTDTRRLNPGGALALADEVFRAPYYADEWMVSEIVNLGDKRHLDGARGMKVLAARLFAVGLGRRA